MLPLVRQRRLLVVLFLSVLAPAGCAASEVEVTAGPGAFSPLALTRAGNGEEARTEGVLQITDTCVFLVHGNERSLLIWPSPQTEWDATSQTILFRDRRGQVHRLAHGQRVAFGGGGGSAGEGPPGQLDGVPWVVAPMPECLEPAYWFVGDLAT